MTDEPLCSHSGGAEPFHPDSLRAARMDGRTDRQPWHPAAWRGEERRSAADTDTVPHADHLSLPLPLQKGSAHLSHPPFFPFLLGFFPSTIRGGT